MPSKMVTDREKSSLAVEAAAEVQAEAVAARLGPLLASVLRPGETVPDVALLSRLLGRLVAERRDRMVAADDAAADERDDASAPRRRRDAAVVELRRVLAAVRATVGQVFGPEPSRRAFGLGGRLRDPLVVVRQADRLLARLRDPAFALPPARLSGIAIEPTRWVAEIEPPLAALQQALQAVELEAAEGRLALHAKRAALGDNDEILRGAAQILEALSSAAGLHDLARTVRLSRRRPAKEQTEPEPAALQSAAAEPERRAWPPPEASRTGRKTATRRRPSGSFRSRD